MELSIIIPYYNADHYIARCLNSLLDQNLSLDSYEIIIIDDGSKDSKDVLMSYVNQHPNIHYYYQSNSRQGAARNNGLRRAKGDYVLFVDADDIFVRNSLSYILDLVRSNSLDVLFYGVRLINNRSFDEDLNPQDNKTKDISNIVSGLDYISSPTSPWLFIPTQFIINRSFLFNNNIQFKENWIIREDWSYILDLLSPASRVASTNCVCYYYIQNQGSIMHSGWNDEYSRSSIDYITYTQQILKNSSHITSHPCAEVVRKWIEETIFIMLGKMLKYCKPNLTVRYINELKSMGCYPFKNRDGILKIRAIKRIMNIPFLWVLSSYFFNISERLLFKSRRYLKESIFV